MNFRLLINMIGFTAILIFLRAPIYFAVALGWVVGYLSIILETKK